MSEYRKPTPDALIAAIRDEVNYLHASEVAAIAAVARKVVIQEADYVLKHAESIDKVKGAADGFPDTHVLWDAGELLLREFDVPGREYPPLDPNMGITLTPHGLRVLGKDQAA